MYLHSLVALLVFDVLLPSSYGDEMVHTKAQSDGHFLDTCSMFAYRKRRLYHSNRDDELSWCSISHTTSR